MSISGACKTSAAPHKIFENTGHCGRSYFGQAQTRDARVVFEMNVPPEDNILLMTGDDKARALALAAFEENAEVLVAYQLDLLAQLERQLRAAHHLMRSIEKLRNVRKRRAGRELSNGERGDTLSHLDVELDEIDAQVREQRQLSRDMHSTVDQMQAKLKQFRQVDRRPRSSEEASE
jgi:hypothetical protein